MTVHSFICMVEWFTCLAGFIFGLVTDNEDLSFLWYTSLIMLVIGFPVLNEIILALKAFFFRSSLAYNDKEKVLEKCIPIVYSPGYNITLCGIEKCHPFDSTKYYRVFNFLCHSGIITD